MNPGTAQTLCQIGIALFSILAILCGYGTYHYGNKVEEQRSISREKQQTELKDAVQNNIKTNEEIKKILLQDMSNFDRNERNKLLSKYPAGYCLFAIDHKNIIIPYESRLAVEFQINWNTAMVINSNSKEITIQLPDIYQSEQRNTFTGNKLILKNKVGAAFSGLYLFDLNIIAEILDIDENGTIIILGFVDIKNKAN